MKIYQSAVMLMLLSFLAICFIAQPCCGQDFERTVTAEVAPVEIREASNSFHRELIRAASKSPEVKRIEVVRLRIALMSPAFRAHCEDLAVTQMYFSGGELPMTEAGVVDRGRIDWESLTAFLEKLLPLILMLLEILK